MSELAVIILIFAAYTVLAGALVLLFRDKDNG